MMNVKMPNNNAVIQAIPSTMHTTEADKVVVDKPNYKHKFILIGSILLLISAAFTTYKLSPYFSEFKTTDVLAPFESGIATLGLILLSIQLLVLAYIFVLYLKYKPVESVMDSELPTCTVIVPAYNEGELVYHTLISLVQSDYPKDKLQILAIDDGSKDDTWEWMLKAKDLLGDRISVCQQPKNQGKRHALYRGFNEGIGEIFVTVDSDSVVDTDTLRNLVGPFVANKSCGAVAGNVKVLNENASVFNKMLNVSFAFSFEFVRSAQSTIGSVFCTPGALSAYRRDAVMNCLEDWIQQTFNGKPSDIGEDRAMTNMILKQGLEVRFQKNSNVYTNTPEHFENLYKMYIRWERSNVRENIMMSKFAFTKFRKTSTFGIRLLLIQEWLKMTLAFPLLFLMIAFIITQPVLFICSTLASILVFSSIQAFFYAKNRKSSVALWAYPYSLLYAFGLFWITPYAIATAAKGGWLTRELPTTKSLETNKLAA